MPIKIQKLLLFFIVVVLFSNCKSVKQYNYELAQPISVEKLHKDIDYTQRKLNRLYPNLHGYISKEKLDFKFDSIRKVVNKPMTSKEFYFVISPVIASVRQGHMTMSPVLPKFTKKENKRLKKAGDGPMSQFVYEWENDKLFITQNKSANKKIELGSEVVSVNGIQPQAIYSKYKNSLVSDGFNTTYIRKSFSKRYTTFMTNEIGVNDSLKFVFKEKDSVFEQTISRFKKDNKAGAKVKTKVKVADSVKVAVKKPVDKKKLKEESKYNKIYGYNKLLNEYAKSLKFFQSDSSVAILRVKNFSEGIHKKAYKAIFDSIKKKNIKNLIIDVRDNPGGRVADAVDLYSHLTDKEFIILQPAIVTSKTSLFKLGLFRNIPKLTYPFAAAFYPFYMGFSYFRTTKTSDGTYQYKLVGSKKRPNAENYFDGKIYVLINGGSFSASCILSSSLKANPNVTFVGEETGGAFNGTVAGIMPLVDLPNSKIPLRLGLMDIKTINQTNVDGRGIFPDIEIPLTVKDKVKNKDPQLDWILENIKKKR
jgi:C-terminal processing protease CtpA/Prc